MAVEILEIQGNAGNDAELVEITTRSGRKVAVVRLDVAVTTRWTDQNGERQEHTEWYQASAFDKLANAARLIKKGEKVHFWGTPRPRAWIAKRDGEIVLDSDGEPEVRCGISLSVTRINLIGNAQNRGNSRDDADADLYDSMYQASSEDYAPPPASLEEIPF